MWHAVEGVRQGMFWRADWQLLLNWRKGFSNNFGFPKSMLDIYSPFETAHIWLDIKPSSTPGKAFLGSILVNWRRGHVNLAASVKLKTSPTLMEGEEADIYFPWSRILRLQQARFWMYIFVYNKVAGCSGGHVLLYQIFVITELPDSWM